MADDLDIYVNADGSIEYVYDDALVEVFRDEDPHTRRASRVDYDNQAGGWMVDVLTPRSEREAELYGQYLAGHWFWSRVSFDGDCWIRAGGGNAGSIGYAAVRPPRAAGLGRRMVMAHRLAYWLAFGDWPSLVRHTCDRPRCVRPSHLIVGTQRDNVIDAVVRNRAANGNIKLTPTNWIDIASSQSMAKKVATDYGISESHVRKIRRRGGNMVYRPKRGHGPERYAPVRLGPFNTRAEALGAEIEFLSAQMQARPLAFA